MANRLSVRRVKVQTIDEQGNPVDAPSYGVMAADDHAQSYNDCFDTLESLNKAIDEAGCILSVINDADNLFDGFDPNKIGKGEFYSEDWKVDD